MQKCKGLPKWTNLLSRYNKLMRSGILKSVDLQQQVCSLQNYYGSKLLEYSLLPNDPDNSERENMESNWHE